MTLRSRGGEASRKSNERLSPSFRTSGQLARKAGSYKSNVAVGSAPFWLWLALPLRLNVLAMSPTVFTERGYRFFFFSREEERMHVHIHSPAGEAKFWLEPEIVLARNYGLSDHDLTRIRRIIEAHENELRNAWRTFFGR